MVTHLLIHGFAGTPVSWAPLIPRLDGNVVAPSLPGHNSPALPSFAAYVDWLMAQCAGLSEPVHLVGYSAGGRIVAAALARGVRCATATLVSSSFGRLSTEERAERRASDAEWSRLLRDEGIAAFISRWEAQLIFASQKSLAPQVIADRRAERTSLDPVALADAMDALSVAGMPDVSSALAGLEMPWQMVVGALDTKYVALARASGAGQVAEIAGCGHDVPLEKPAALATLLNHFVGGLA